MNISPPLQAENFFEPLTRAGFQVYLVGGAVRDLLRGVPPHDLDLCTDAPPEEMKRVFSGFRVLETGIAHGTLTVLSPDGARAEITTMRAEGAYSDARHPDNVRFVHDIRKDLARRDFTVGAMALSPEGELIDPFGGKRDLEDCLLRTVGDARARFSEDALRILRLLRFSSVLGFTMEKETLRAAEEEREKLRLVARERLFSEFCLLLCGADAERVLSEGRKIVSVLVPAAAEGFDFDQKSVFHIYDVYTHILKTVAAVEPTPKLRLAAFYHDLGKPRVCTLGEDGHRHFKGHHARSEEIARESLTSFGAPRALTEDVCRLVRFHDTRFAATEKAARRALAQHGEAGLMELLSLQYADAEAHAPDVRERACADLDAFCACLEEVLRQNACVSLSTLAVGGEDLMALGVPPSPEMGKILEKLLCAVVDGEAENTREALLERARALLEK